MPLLGVSLPLRLLLRLRHAKAAACNSSLGTVSRLSLMGASLDLLMIKLNLNLPLSPNQKYARVP